MSNLKGDFVIHRAFRLGGRALVFGLSAAGPIAAVGATQEDYAFGRDLVRSGRGTVLACPYAGAPSSLVRCDTAFHQHLATGLQILVADLGLFAPSGDTEPYGFFYLFPIGTRVLAVGG